MMETVRFNLISSRKFDASVYLIGRLNRLATIIPALEVKVCGNKTRTVKFHVKLC